MGYKDRTLRLEFPELGDGLYVVLRNPRLMPPDTGQPNIALSDTDGLLRAGKRRVARLLIDWHLWDARVEDDDVPLRLPTVDDLEPFDGCPDYVMRKVSREVNRLSDPT